jgi:flagellar motility protein MotE (MotC chaperone)
LPAPTTKPPEIKPPVVNGQQIQLDGNRPVSAAERAILERLHERRQELDKRARELDIREGMLKETEQRINAQMKEIKEVEAKEGPSGQKKEESGTVRFKTLAVMYENMKPKDAAKIFDRLDIKVLLDMTSQINPRKMSEILAQMSPDAAERLTMELANRANGGEKAANTNALPKIEGRPNGS